MSSTYAGNPDNYPSTVRYAQDGDGANETVMIAPTMEDLADRTAWLHKAHTVGSPLKMGVASAPMPDDGDWEHDVVGWMHSLTAGGDCYWMIDPPHGSTITAIAILYDGAAHGGSWPPAVRTALRLIRFDLTSAFAAGGGSVIQSGSDNSAQATYETFHEFGASGFSEVVDRRSYAYAIGIRNESGANSVATGHKAGIPRYYFTPGQFPGGL